MHYQRFNQHFIKQQHLYSIELILTMHPKPLSRPSTSIKSSTSDHDTSRLSFSMTSSTVYAHKYPKCDFKKQHNKQLLNLICINEGCKAKGPICAMCKNTEHATHNVLPIKKFFENVQLSIKKRVKKNESKAQQQIMIKQEKNVMDNSQLGTLLNENSGQTQNIPKVEQSIAVSPEKMISELILAKQKMLYTLSIHIEALASQIQKIEQRIISEIDTSIEQVKNSLNLEHNLQNLVDELQDNEDAPMSESKEVDSERQGKKQKQKQKDAKIFKQKVGMLLTMLNCKTKDNYEINSQGSTKLYENAIKTGDSFIANMNQWAAESDKILSKSFEYNPNACKKQPQQKQKQQVGTQYKFSPDLKIKSIHLSNENKIAKQTQKIAGLAVIVGPSLKQKRMRFKVLSMSNSVNLGVGFKDIIKQNNYKFNPANIGHGTYMIGQNSHLYSHHNKANNMVLKGLTFASGDEIIMTVKSDSVNFVKKSDNKSTMLTLKKMNEDDWNLLVPCVYLGGIGDKVEILAND